MRTRYRWIGLAFALGLCPVAHAQDESADCGSLKNGYGPYDYRVTSPEQRAIVEDVHFTPKVENLKGGNTTMTPGGDLAYTLRVFPNSPRALMTLIRLAEKEKTSKPRDMEYTVSCWFERAERFQPKDAMVKALHGIYLTRAGKPKDGAAMLQAAADQAGDNANVNYNLGLAYFDLQQFDKSLESAHKAYALGFPLPGLREKLKRAGKWRDPPPPPPAAAEEPAAPAPTKDSGATDAAPAK
jgi:tetratricopeptide (TPR) repeat protein